MAETDPARIDRIRELEATVVAVAERRAQARGEELERPPAFFRLRQRDRGGKNGFVPIDRVVEWARTSRGGRQFDMFAPQPPDAGCMRWGLCDTADEPGVLHLAQGEEGSS